MSKLNTVPKSAEVTHEGGPAKRINALQALRRSVCSCLLWEKEFYEDGQTIADRIAEHASKVSRSELSELAVEVRKVHKLRHVPLLLLAVLASRRPNKVWTAPVGTPAPAPDENLNGDWKEVRSASIVKESIERTIWRADEMGEFLAIYAKLVGAKTDEIKPVLPAQVKKGLAAAFRKFDAYQLGKYNRKGAFSLKDLILLTHPKPENEDQAKMWKSVLDGTLEAPDTWEVNLSSGKDKGDTFTRLLKEKRLGYLALLRNLRGMVTAGVDVDLIRGAIAERRGADRVLPFRYIAAARACPQLEPAIDMALCQSVEESEPLEGKTIVLVDVSMSMEAPLSDKSDMSRMDAACALASVINGDLRVFSFSSALCEVPPRRGIAGVDVVKNSQSHGGTYLGAALSQLNKEPHDRIIVVTDEQSSDRVPDPVAKRGYMINVASNQNGVGYGRWTHIDGFSESVIRFIHEYERLED